MSYFRWFTTKDFKSLAPLDVFHKEQDNEIVKSEIKNYHCLARCEYELNEDDAILNITADDYYKLYINGKFITQGPAPSYNSKYYYNQINITQHLHRGKNIIAVHLYYQGLINRVWQSGDNRFGIGAKINGKNLNWKYKVSTAYSGNILGYDTAFTESFDARCWDSDWNTVDFDDSDWENMIEVQGDYNFVKQETKQLSLYSIKPNIKKSKGVIFCDCGEETVGMLKFTANSKSDGKIIVHFGEELDCDGNVKYHIRANCAYEEELILGNGICNWENYDYKAFRYAEIFFGNSNITDIEVITRHYPFDDEMCVLTSSDESLTKIFNLCKRTVKLAAQEIFIDCPTREKGQYLGDTFITAHSHLILTKDNSMLRKAIDNFAQSSNICKGLMAVAPCSLMQEIADYSLLFGELLLIDYNFTKDKFFLRQYYETAKNIILHFKQYENERGLLDTVKDKWNLVDWPENCRDDYDFPLSRPIVGNGMHNVINAYYIGAIKTLNKIEDILGIEKSFNFKIRKKAYIETFFKDGLFADSDKSRHTSLHSNVFALYFDLVPQENKQKVIDFIISKGFCCSPYTSYFLLKALTENGRYKDAYKLIINDGEYGWLNMIKEGATCCFEAWSKEQKWNTSLCHSWSSAPIIIIAKDLINADIDNLTIKLTSHGGSYALSDNE